MDLVFWTLAIILGAYMEWSTFWAAVEALATVGAIYAITVAIRQLRFESWNSCQELFTNAHSSQDRTALFKRLDTPDHKWKSEELTVAIRVAGQMDALCRLARYFGEDDMVRVWGNPIAKAWLLSHSVVRQERDRTHWRDKWYAFEIIAAKSISQLDAVYVDQYSKHGDALGALYAKRYKLVAPPSAAA